MSDSPNLGLPYIEAGQAQKHLPHNDALALLDGLVQLMVVSRGLNAPPASFNDGDRFLIGSSPTGLWAGKAGLIAFSDSGNWTFLAPRAGFLAWIAAENLFTVFDGAVWSSIPPPDNLLKLGVNATADATNKLVVASAAVLFNHVGHGMQLKLNKYASADTASLLFQTNWGGRAEMGTAGDDGFHLKVSADGSSWTEALVVDPASGLAKAAADPSDPLGLVTKRYADALRPPVFGALCASHLMMN